MTNIPLVTGNDPGAAVGALNALINASNIRFPESVYAKIRRLAANARAGNPHLAGPGNVPAVMATPPTITNPAYANQAAVVAAGFPTFYPIIAPGSSPNALASQYSISGGQAQFKFGIWLQVYCVTLNLTGSGNVGNNPGISGVATRVSFVADAAKVVLGTTASNSAGIRFLVNGVYVSLASTTTAAAQPYILLDFTSAGGRQKRTITIESMQGSVFLGVNVQGTETVSAVPQADSMTAVFFGDSLTGGSNATLPADGYAMVCGDALGITDIRASGSGGTGYVATNAGASLSFPQRVPFDVNAVPGVDMVFFVGGVNDNGLPAAQIQAGLLSCISQIRALNQTLPIFVCGVWNAGNTTGLAASTVTENLLFSSITPLNDPNLFAVPISTDPAGSFLTGTGETSAPTGTGNADVYMNSYPHPNTLGHQYYGERLAYNILTAIQGLP